MNTHTKATEALKYYELQLTLLGAVNALNTGSSLPNATYVPYTREDAMAQLPAIRELIARREREIEALKDAVMEVDLGNRFGGLDAYLAH